MEEIKSNGKVKQALILHPQLNLAVLIPHQTSRSLKMFLEREKKKGGRLQQAGLVITFQIMDVI